MVGAERDSTQDWLLPEDKTPPTLRELEGRIEEALTTARASEAAVMTVGAAALDAAEQARRAAKLAERAASSAAEAGAHGRPPTATGIETPAKRGPVGGTEDFDERADRLMERLRRLQRVPLGPASGVADRLRSRP